MTDVSANRDDEQITLLVDAGDVAVVATAREGADDQDVLAALAELDRELEIGLSVLNSERPQASDDDVQEAVEQIEADGGTDRQLTRLDCPSCDDAVDARYLGTASTDEHDGHIVGWECTECGAELQERVDSCGCSFDLQVVEQSGRGGER
jgi:hypothetical protein